VLESFCLAVILLIAGYFRVYNSSLSFFSLDQVRDFWLGWQISTGNHFPLQGTEQQCSFTLGPFFYYMTALAFLISDSLHAPYVQVGLADCLSVLLCYGFTRSYFGRRAALMAATFYAVSVEAVFIGRFPGDTGYVHLLVIGYLWLFARFLESGSWRWLLCASTVLGLALQFHTSVFFLLPLSGLMTVWRFRGKAWRPMAMAVIVVILAHLPLLISEFQTGFNNTKQIFGLMNREIAGHSESAYFSRLSGALLFNSLAGSMLLPKNWSMWFQPFFIAQSFLYLLGMGSCAVFRMKDLWLQRQWQVAVLLMAWLLIVLIVYPLYPRVNHNYIEAIHPGAMILLSAVIVQMRGRIKTFLGAGLLVVAAANLVFLAVMDEYHTRKTGMIRLYRSSLVDLTDLTGSNNPIVETVPAGMQIRANERLLNVFGSRDAVLKQFHGIGRLFFLDENNRFILAYLSQQVNCSRSVSNSHYYAVGFNRTPCTKMPDDLHLVGPYYLRPAAACEAVLGDQNPRILPTWTPADYSVYNLITVRSLQIKKSIALSIRPVGGKVGTPFHYVLMVAYATRQETPLGAQVMKYGQGLVYLKGTHLDTLPFTGATVFHVPWEPTCEKAVRVWLNGSPSRPVDVDVYAEACS
jgi:4-amino-4-deoxy-L-arabinose transferase-like glycosyltransferase